MIPLWHALVVKNNGSNDDEGKSNGSTEKSSNKEPRYALLTGYYNTGYEFELKEMYLHVIINELNLTYATVSMVMMEDKEESGVLIDAIQ